MVLNITKYEKKICKNIAILHKKCYNKSKYKNLIAVFHFNGGKEIKNVKTFNIGIIQKHS